MLHGAVRCASRACFVALLLLGALFASRPAYAAVVLAEIAANIPSPTDIQNARDGSGRLFLVQLGGQIKVWKNGAVLPTPFLNFEPGACRR
jgi:hypothetical protein